MSQYWRPESVFTPSPVTFVGALVFGTRTGVVLWLAVCARSESESKVSVARLVIRIGLIRFPLFQCDDVNFYQHIFGEAGHFDCGSSRGCGAEIFPVDLIHGCEIVHALEEHAATDDFAEPTSGGFEDLRQ